MALDHKHHPLKSGTGAPETTIGGQEKTRVQGMLLVGEGDLEQPTTALYGNTPRESDLSSPLSTISPLDQEPLSNVVVSEQQQEDEEPSPEEQDGLQQHEESMDTFYPSTTMKAPTPASLYPRGSIRQKKPLSPLTQSTASSIADLNNSSSASITANMLAIKSHVFVQQDHQQPRLMPVVVAPIYQLSTPMSSTNSLSSPSRSASPAHHHHHPAIINRGSTPLITQSGIQEPSATPTDNSTAHRLIIPTKEELRPGKNSAVKNPSTKSRSSKKGHSSTSSSCSCSSSLASPVVDETDPGKNLPPLPTSSSEATATATATTGATIATSHRSQSSQHHHHDHSFLDDLKSKTQNVLRKAGFSIAPEAGLFADRGSTKSVDLKVTRLFPASVPRQSHITIVDPKDANGGNGGGGGKSTGFFGRPRSRSFRELSRPSLEMAPAAALGKKATNIITSSVSTNVLTMSPATTVNPPSPPASSSMSVFKLPWNFGHQRSNSGPARPSDWSIRPKRRMTVGLESAPSDRILLQDPHHTNSDHARTGSGPLPPLPPLPTSLATVDGGIDRVTAKERKEKGHQRRVSDATTLTMTSIRSGGTSPQRFQLQHLQHVQQHYQPMPGSGLAALPVQAIPEKQPRSMGNWFGMVAKRRSFPSAEEDDALKRRSAIGHGFEYGGMGSQRNSMIVLEDGDEDLDDLDEDSDLEEDEHAATGEEGGRSTPVERKVRRRRQVLVNDYGFICDPEDNNSTNGGSGNNEGQQGSGLHLTSEIQSTGSMVSEIAARFSEPGSFLAEHERRRLLKKQQEFARNSEVKWIQAISHLQPDQVKKLTKFKKLARGGVPPSIRGRVWQFLANVDHYREPGLFQDLLSRGHLPIHDVIARDVHRCYPDHVHFRDGMGGTGQEDLHSILKAYAHYKPSVGYCQGMGRLVGMMLMQMPVEEAFWLLVATLEEGYLNDYFTPTLRQLRIDALVFERLLKAQDPRLAQHLESNDVSPIMYITPWFLTLFTLSLPWASVLRVWDVFYFDGVKTLFRIGLGILQICRSTLLEDCPSSAECMDFLLHVPLDRLGPEVLLDRTAFRIRLKRESLEKMSVLTAGEMDAKEASRCGGVGAGSGPVNEQQKQGQQQEEEDKKKNKRSMMSSLRGTKPAAGAGASSIMTTTSSPPTSATSREENNHHSRNHW
ncbi:hypothetical protein BGX23_009459 [Mortierella sp. AD031]|nr:hypothetical protein BGX23_009459 [Mortierella sp. AD031]